MNGWIIFCLNGQNISLHIIMWTMCFLNKQTFRHNWCINIRFNGQMFLFKERTMFCYNLSERAADNILPQMANVLPQCLYHFYEFILPYKKFEFFHCSHWISLKLDNKSPWICCILFNMHTAYFLIYSAFCIMTISTNRNLRPLEAASDWITPMIVAGSFPHGESVFAG